MLNYASPKIVWSLFWWWSVKDIFIYLMLFMTGSKSNGSGGLLREVACPVCTVHLQVRNTYKYYLPFVTSLGWLCLLVVPIYRCKFQHLDLRRLNVAYVSTLFSLVLISVALNFTIWRVCVASYCLYINTVSIGLC